MIPPESLGSTYLVENTARLEQMLEALVQREVGEAATRMLGPEVCT